jgi:phosphoglycerate kinase
MKTINDYNFRGKKALIRVDFNVPQNEKLEVTDTTRILAAKPTIDKILQDGGSVILMTHLGRPKGKFVEEMSLKPIVNKISEVLGVEVQFCSESVGEKAIESANKLEFGQVLLLENLRFHIEEEKGDKKFAEELAKLGDIYVNDAFGTAHRAHASTAIIANYFQSKCFGYLMAKELESIDKVIHIGKHPITAIIGGSKVSSKISIIENILPFIDNLIIGGGMIFTFIKAKGGKIGNSLVEEDYLQTALSIIEKAEKNQVKIYLPIDVLVADKFDNQAKTQMVLSEQIPDGWQGLDIGNQSIEDINKIILDSKTILWNGPLGVFEMSNFANGTIKLGESIAKATQNGAFSLVGGGDSVAAVKQFGLENKMSFVSTGGGAMLESLEGKKLPGVEIILDK